MDTPPSVLLKPFLDFLDLMIHDHGLTIYLVVPVKAPIIPSDRNAVRFLAGLRQLLFSKVFDFFLLTFGDVGRGKNVTPLDLMLAGDFPGAVIGCQL